jgi:PAT family beta-lactamase induction signal transducer AmpG
MALSMMIPGMFAGYLQEALGYEHFFWMVIACCIATVCVTFFAIKRIDPDYGKK